MSLIIKSKNNCQYIPIFSPSCKNEYEIRDLDFIPQQVWDHATRAKIGIDKGPHFYMVISELPGVELKNLWVCIEGRTLSLYAGVTGKVQEDGTYRYTEELLGGIRGKIELPKDAYQGSEVVVEFCFGVLFLEFPKKADDLSSD